MLFTSDIFIFLFLPFTIIFYYILRKRKFKNLFLLIMSLLFYAYGEPRFVIIMILSIIINYITGLLINKFKLNKRLSKLLLTIGIVYNLGILIIFKYLMFLLENINTIFKSHIPIPNILLPIGISFFTFQILSYIIDVYRGKIKVQKNIFNLGLYISFFPQLIAGPIVRYETIQNQINDRKETIDKFYDGLCRFVIGFSKKVLIANTMATIVDKIFNNPIDTNISVATVWITALAYALQIYYDFSGYSDMAIGLGKMFGFDFKENFNYPYFSKSITEFWRRWHISLGSWFRDYLYIPLGGSKVKNSRLIFNLFIVWLCTGIWHGANWTFIVWGLMYFVLLVLEKLFKQTEKNNLLLLRHAYTIFFVILGWIIFRSDNLTYALTYIKRMFTFKNFVDYQFFEFLFENIVIFMIAIIVSLGVIDFSKYKNNKIFNFLSIVFFSILFIISISYLIKGVYNPFIYFNF